MSQYPPPPPSYGAYDQPPPPGFGYPPGNQGPYYPQPGYPQPPYQPGGNPTTCPPGPGGYYPGQPATQTIEKGDTCDTSSSKNKEQSVIQEANPSSITSEEYNSLQVASEYDNKNSKTEISAVDDGDNHKCIGSEQHDEKKKSATPDVIDMSQKRNDSEANGEKCKPSPPEYYVDSQRQFTPEADGEIFSSYCICQKRYDFLANGEEYESSPPEYSVVCPEAYHGEMLELKALKCDDISQKSIVSEEIRERYKPIPLKGVGFSQESTASETDGGKYKPIPLKWVDSSEKQIFPEVHCEKSKRLTSDSLKVVTDETKREIDDDEHKLNAPRDKCRSLTPKVYYKGMMPTAPESDHDDLKEKGPKRAGEKFKTLELDDYPAKVKPSAPELSDGKHSKDEKSEKPNRQPQSFFTNNDPSSNFTNINYPVITTQPTQYNRFGESDGTDCCNDDCCEGDCGGDNCCKDDCGGDDCCKEDCCNDDCCKDECCRDDCCTDDQAIESCVYCLCICIFALIESSNNKS